VEKEKDTISKAQGFWTSARQLMWSSDMGIHTFGHYEFWHKTPRTPEEWKWKEDNIGIVYKDSLWDEAVVMYHDRDHWAEQGARRAKDIWYNTIVPKADTYEYGEQNPLGKALTKWPQSHYELVGNNSNTFAQMMSALIPRNAKDYLGACEMAPGNFPPVPPASPQTLYQAVPGPDPALLANATGEYWPPK
jgi:hypothetical protein